MDLIFKNVKNTHWFKVTIITFLIFLFVFILIRFSSRFKRKFECMGRSYEWAWTCYVITFMLSSSLYALVLYDKFSNHLGIYQPISVPIIFLLFHVFVCRQSPLKYSPFLACYSWLLAHFGLSIGCLVSPNYYQTKTILSISGINYARLFFGFNDVLRKEGEERIPLFSLKD